VENHAKRLAHSYHAKFATHWKTGGILRNWPDLCRIRPFPAPGGKAIDRVYQFSGINRFYVLHRSIYMRSEPF